MNIPELGILVFALLILIPAMVRWAKQRFDDEV